jgi:hypothetical protein
MYNEKKSRMGNYIVNKIDNTKKISDLAKDKRFMKYANETSLKQQDIIDIKHRRH